MAQILRQLATKARSALTVSSPSWTSLPFAASGAESQQLTTLLSFRSFSSGTAHVCAPTFDDSSATPPTSSPVNNIPPPAWTPTRLLDKRKTLPKRMGNMLLALEKEKELAAMEQLQRPTFGPGDLLELKLSVPENKRRATIFKGICIARRNRGWRTSFTLRNFIGNSGGIERSFPLYSPHVLEIKVLKVAGRKKYRRAKLYFLRDVQPKEYRVQ